jgi:hypothetical protein
MRSLLRARELGPGLADVDDLIGRILSERDVPDDCIAHLERAIWIAPSFVFARVDLARVHAYVRDWPRVDRVMEDLRAISPDHQALVGARMALWSNRREGIAPWAKIGHPGIDHYSDALFRVVHGTPVSAESWAGLVAIAKGAPPRSRPRRLFTQILTEMSCVLGRYDEAMTYLDESVAAGLVDIAWMRHCPLLDPLRERAPFAERVAEVAAAAEPATATYRAAMGG